MVDGVKIYWTSFGLIHLITATFMTIQNGPKVGVYYSRNFTTKMNPDFFKIAKSSLTIPQLWSKLGLPGEPKVGINHSPCRKDTKPSLSIFAGGQRFKDHATDESGDIFDFYKMIYKCDDKEAIRVIGELLGIKNEIGEYSLPICKVERKAIYSAVTTHEISRPKEPIKWTLRLDTFLEKKRIKKDIFSWLYDLGYVSLENDVLNYHYSTGIKVRWDWDSSSSTRWKIGGASDAVWVDGFIKNPYYNKVVICEGESDLARLYSYGVSDKTTIIAMPSASWTPSEVLAGTIGNCRTVIMPTDNDDSGYKARERVSKVIADNSIGCRVLDWDWGNSSENDLCECDDEALKLILEYNNIEL